MAAMLFTTASFADVNTTASQQQQQQAASSAGNSWDNHTVNQASDISNMVPNVSAPNLATTLTETCMGSSSVGASGAGFGFSFGSTWRDSACVRRLDARQLSAFGDVVTAREVMCDSELVRAAAVRAGRACVADGGTAWGTPVAAIVTQTQEVPTPEAAAPVVTQTVHE